MYALALKHSDVVFILLINVKMPTIVCHTYWHFNIHEQLNFMLSSVEREKSFVILRPGPEVIKLFSCSTQLSTKFILLINVK